MRIDNQTGDFIVFVGNDGLMQELFQRHRPAIRAAIIAPRYRLRPPPDGRRSAAACLGQEIAEIIEDIGGGIDGVAIDHGGSGPSALHCAMSTAKTISSRFLRSKRLAGAWLPAKGGTMIQFSRDTLN
jgi:hypothetical protein